MNIAIQKNGKLTEPSLAYLNACGIAPTTRDGLIWQCKNNDSQLIALRDDDIPKVVSEGYADVGIVGENVLQESGVVLPLSKKLGFGKCTLVIAIPGALATTQITDLSSQSIATSYPKILTAYLKQQVVEAKVVYLSGSVEAAPRLGLATAVCDLVITGQTLRDNNLRPIAKVMESEAVLIANDRGALQQLTRKKKGLIYQWN